MTASDVRTVTVRLPEPLHRAVKVRCAERGDSLEGVARAAFVAYLERDESVLGSVLERAGVRPSGLDAGSDVPGAAVTGDVATDGEARHGVTTPRPRVRISPSLPASSPERPFRPDPKGGSKT